MASIGCCLSLRQVGRSALDTDRFGMNPHNPARLAVVNQSEDGPQRFVGRKKESTFPPHRSRGGPASDHFPSYELIAENYTRGTHFEDELRSVTTTGVEQTTRLFLSHYLGAETSSTLVNEANLVIAKRALLA